MGNGHRRTLMPDQSGWKALRPVSKIATYQEKKYFRTRSSLPDWRTCVAFINIPFNNATFWRPRSTESVINCHSYHYKAVIQYHLPTASNSIHAQANIYITTKNRKNESTGKDDLYDSLSQGQKIRRGNWLVSRLKINSANRSSFFSTLYTSIIINVRSIFLSMYLQCNSSRSLTKTMPLPLIQAPTSKQFSCSVLATYGLKCHLKLKPKWLSDVKQK